MYKKIILIVSLLFTTQLFAKKQALLIGVSNYKGEVSDLPGIDYDIEKMKKLFITWGFDVKVLLNDESMLTEKYLKMYATSLSENDVFTFYYSGHGSYALDTNGDEEDGQDESIVLSDGNRDYHYLDDELNYRLNKIKAKKLIIFDSCHSGTANKGKSKFRVKSLPKNKITAVYFTKSHNESEIKGDQFVILSASKDYEESLATEKGSLFTNELYKSFSDKSTLNSLKESVTNNIIKFCKKNKVKPYHPNLTVSDNLFKSLSIDEYLLNSVEQVRESSLELQLDSMIENTLFNKVSFAKSKSSYVTGDFVTFTLNTNGITGYLTLLYMDKDDITILYPNPKLKLKQIQGVYNFPKDFGNFKIEAYKNCTNCKNEQTKI